MRKGNGTREQAIAIVGLRLIEKVEELDCEPTNRLQTDGDIDDVEFSASVDFTDGDGYNRTLTAYYYQDQEDLDNLEDGDLGALNWQVEGYEID